MRFGALNKLFLKGNSRFEFRLDYHKKLLEHLVAREFLVTKNINSITCWFGIFNPKSQYFFIALPINYKNKIKWFFEKNTVFFNIKKHPISLQNWIGILNFLRFLLFNFR
ncbi:hypothetical protein MHL_2674 [Mesomycoplasma hyopneumoniae 7422]|nr:hypothetical protein MHL_2674 [Mesomycoplasma hyopneumoniae 7422]